MFDKDGKSDIITPYKVVKILKVVNFIMFPIRIIISLIEKIHSLFKSNKVDTYNSILNDKNENIQN